MNERTKENKQQSSGRSVPYFLLGAAPEEGTGTVVDCRVPKEIKKESVRGQRENSKLFLA